MRLEKLRDLNVSFNAVFKFDMLHVCVCMCVRREKERERVLHACMHAFFVCHGVYTCTYGDLHPQTCLDT